MQSRFVEGDAAAMIDRYAKAGVNADLALTDGIAEIPIEQRGGEEVATVRGSTAAGKIETVRIVPDGSPVANYGFDVTPSRLVTALITERGIIPPTRSALAKTFPERGAAIQLAATAPIDKVPRKRSR